jgi:hypothetical protein
VIADNGAKARICDLAAFPLTKSMARSDDGGIARIMSEQIRSAAKQLAFDNASVREGTTKERRYLRPTGHEVREFIGLHSFVKDLMPEARQARITDPVALAMATRGLIKF